MTFLLTVVGILLLLLSLAGVAFGSFMALDPRTREPGLYFALWWVPAVAAAVGILLADPVTFAIGAFCFVVAGVAFALERGGSQRAARGSRTRSEDAEKRPLPEGTKSWVSEKTQRRSSAATGLPAEAKRLYERAQRWLSEKARSRK